MSYPTTKTANINGSSIRALTSIPDTLTAHGITPPTDIITATTRHAKIIAHITAITAATDVDGAHETAARALADGTGTLEQLTAAAATRMVAAKDPNSPYRKILSRARDLAAKDLRDAYAAHGDKWITDILRPGIDKAAATIAAGTQYAPTFDAFRDATAADHLTTNPAVADAWATLRALYGVARVLRQYRVTPGTDRRDDWFEWSGNPDYTTQKAGETLTASIRDNLRDGNLTWYLTATQHGMTPTLLTDTEAADNQQNG